MSPFSEILPAEFFHIKKTSKPFDFHKASRSVLICEREWLGLRRLHRLAVLRHGRLPYIPCCQLCESTQHSMTRMSLRLICIAFGRVYRVSSCKTGWLGSPKATSQLLPDLVRVASIQPLSGLMLRGAVVSTIVSRSVYDVVLLQFYILVCTSGKGTPLLESCVDIGVLPNTLLVSRFLPYSRLDLFSTPRSSQYQ